jgi:hypothetical protein
LLGTALLFWGAMTDHPIIAVVLALLIESAHWTRLRWNFNETAYIRAWQISVLSAGAMAIFIWLDGDRFSALPRLLGWLPALFLPVQFTQSFGLRNSIPLNAFSFFARQRQLRNQRLGLKESTAQFNFGNAFLVSCMVASTLGQQWDAPFFLAGLIVLTGWALLASGQTRPAPLICALIAAGGFAFIGQIGLTHLYEQAIGVGGGSNEGPRSPNVVRTAIGALGEIKLSPEIKWRLQPLDNQPPPKLLRTAGYNKYNAGEWKNDKPGGAAKDVDFLDLKTLELTDGEAFFLLRHDADEKATRPSLQRFKLRGAATSNSQLPLPGDAASVRDFELDGIERNSLGTVRIFPKNSVIDGTVLWKDDLTPEEPPDRVDLRIPPPEAAVIRQVAEQLQLAAEPTVEGKIRIIRNWFRSDFHYTRYLSIPPSSGEPHFSTAMSVFLTKEKRGHCEYFASAAALLLREAGVPTRYAVGFAVSEFDPKHKEYVIRGEHGHAWCRVWNEARNAWMDFDATPPNWLSLETNRESSTQWLSDGFLRLREDFFLWRNRPRNRIGASIVMISIGVIALVIVGRRLWKSKHVVKEKQRGYQPTGPTPRTPLHELETIAKELLGPRPAGLPFSRWLLGLKESIADPAQLDEAIALHQRLRYDPAPPEAPVVERLQALVERIKESLGGRA